MGTKKSNGCNKMSSSKRARSLAAFIDATNARYETLHAAYEAQFWGTKMGLSDPSFTKDAENAAKSAMEEMLRDPQLLAETREWKKAGGGSPAQNRCLQIFERTFSTYIMESTDAVKMREEILALEGKLEEARAHLQLSYVDAEGKERQGSSVAMRNTMRSQASESVRQSAYDALSGIGDFVVANGFPEIVKKRNQMARLLGYEDFYDYKVTAAEGFGKERLFQILDTLESATRTIMKTARSQLADSKGNAALQPWNTGFEMAGDVTAKLDPYFPFEKAVEMWGRSFSRLGIGYKGGTLNLDLLDRPGKYSNGFCHWPKVAWEAPDGFRPSTANFTSLADPSAVGPGLTALTTLMHEAGHAAHFANIQQPTPFCAQERAPTSVAYAENQSMFLDSLVGDAAWRGRYARNRKGEPVPWEILAEDIQCRHPFEVFGLRAMLAVPYFEKALYEMPEEDVTPQNIIKLAAETENAIQGGPSPRPLLSVPHILADEASCYYHGYVLAEMSVHQTRAHFLSTYGFIVDNPKVGAYLASVYWHPGNSVPFLELVQKLTGAPLTGDAWVKVLREDVASVLKSEQADYEAAVKAVEAEGGFKASDVVDLQQHMRTVDGDEVLADSSKEGSFLQACQVFEKVVSSRVASNL